MYVDVNICAQIYYQYYILKILQKSLKNIKNDKYVYSKFK